MIGLKEGMSLEDASLAGETLVDVTLSNGDQVSLSSFPIQGYVLSLTVLFLAYSLLIETNRSNLFPLILCPR
jgi:hypothetical protein